MKVNMLLHQMNTARRIKVLLMIKIKDQRELACQKVLQRRNRLELEIIVFSLMILLTTPKRAMFRIRNQSNPRQSRKNKSCIASPQSSKKKSMNLNNNLMSIWRNKARKSNLRWRKILPMSNLKNQSKKLSQKNKLLKESKEVHTKLRKSGKKIP